MRLVWFLRISFLLFVSSGLVAQEADKGSFSGGFQNSSNIFIRDSLIGAFDIPQYDFQHFGAQSWLDLGYTRSGFDLGIRFDVFNNSNLLNPNQSYTCLLYTSPSPRDQRGSRMPSSA